MWKSKKEGERVRYDSETFVESEENNENAQLRIRWENENDQKLREMRTECVRGFVCGSISQTNAQQVFHTKCFLDSLANCPRLYGGSFIGYRKYEWRLKSSTCTINVIFELREESSG